MVVLALHMPTIDVVPQNGSHAWQPEEPLCGSHAEEPLCVSPAPEEQLWHDACHAARSLLPVKYLWYPAPKVLVLVSHRMSAVPLMILLLQSVAENLPC